jgi:chemotaxis protein MotA
MKTIIGILIVFGAVGGGYAMAGGHFGVLWQPSEFIIILGAGMGALVIANPGKVLKKLPKAIGGAIKGSKLKKADYIELLCLQYQVFKLIKSKGILAIESHIENPHESTLFHEFPKFHHNHAVEFLCDYLRMISLGSTNPYVMEDLMNLELDVHHEEDHALSGAVQGLADGMPALGIVAAVLGVIHTMGSITEPPAILGKMIGAALVGTFFGVFVSYGFFAPFASGIAATKAADSKYQSCLKTGILAYLQGSAPSICTEFARKSLTSDVRPSFKEVEEAIEKLPSIK